MENKIYVIRAVREATNLGLLESKELVEKYEYDVNKLTPQEKAIVEKAIADADGAAEESERNFTHRLKQQINLLKDEANDLVEYYGDMDVEDIENMITDVGDIAENAERIKRALELWQRRLERQSLINSEV